MWGIFKNLLSKSDTLNALMGDIVFETPEVQGETSSSLIQWRLKKTLDGNGYLISLKLNPDASWGAEGKERSYTSFDIATAEQIRSSLDLCIAEYHRLSETS